MAEHKSLSAAMTKAFAEIESATKSAANPHFKSKYADLTSVIEAIKPALVNNGLFFTQVPVPHEKGVHIETWLHHESGNSMLMGGLFVPADRNNAQAFGSALTYARRYALVTAFGVPVEDDDGSAAASAPPKSAKPANQESPALITDDQRTELMTLMTHLGVPVKGFLEFAKIKDLRNVRAESFERAKGWINDQAKAKRDALDDDAEFLKGE
jgi:hypothetical protein